MSHPPQGIRHAQAHGLQRREQSGDETECECEAGAEQQITQSQME
jgi:hypothetical protein